MHRPVPIFDRLPGPILHFGAPDQHSLQRVWPRTARVIPMRKAATTAQRHLTLVKKEPEPDIQPIVETPVIEVPPVVEPDPPVVEPEPLPPVLRLPPLPPKTIEKALARGRKTVFALRSSAQISSSHGRPRMISTLTSTAAANKPAAPPKKSKREAAPPLVLNDATYEAHARKALNGFKAKRVVHADMVLAAMLGNVPHGEEKRLEFIVRHAVTRLRALAMKAQQDGAPIDRHFLHNSSSRFYGELMSQAHEVFRRSLQVEEPRVLRRAVKQRRSFSNFPETSELEVHVSEEEEREIYFLIATGPGDKYTIHTVFDGAGFTRWMRSKLDCCADRRDRDGNGPISS
jgi:hypothetical protein